MTQAYSEKEYPSSLSRSHFPITRMVMVSTLVGTTPVFFSNSDQHQISACNINAYSTPKITRIKDMITQGEFLDILITSTP